MTAVSVVMPVRDAERYLPDAVESMLAQSVGDLELIAVDDGSSDGSRRLLEDYAERDARVRVLALEGVGLTNALRAGCAAAAAPYIARMDADDVSLPDRLARQLACLESDPGLAVVGGAVVMIDEHGARRGLVRYPVRDGDIRRRLARSNAFAHPAVTIRRAAYEAVGGYRLPNGEDYDLWLRLAERYRLANLPDTVLLYRHHPAQYSVARVADQAVGVLAAQYAARLRAAGAPDPLDGEAELTPRVLEAVGLTSGRIAEAQAAHQLRWAALLEQLGSPAAARALYESAEERSPECFAVRRALARAQAALGAGRRGAAVRVLVAAAAAHPASFPAAVLRALRGRRSFEPAP